MKPFERLYVLSYVGAFLAFLPLLVLLLPRRVEAVAADDPLILLSTLLLIGGITASFAHILGGWCSDRWIARYGSRRGLIGIGLALLMLAYALLAVADTAMLLIAAIIAHQFTFNIMFSPMGVLLADHVPDQRKGLVAGGMNMALPLAGFGVSALGWLSDADATWPFVLVAGSVALLIVPLILLWPAEPVAEPTSGREPFRLDLLKGDFAKAWCGRALVQLGSASLISYLFLYVDTVARSAEGFSSRDSSAGVALLTLLANIVAIGAGLAAGRASDRMQRRRAPLIAAAMTTGAALALLAAAPSWPLIVLGYALFTAALTAFLSIDGAMVAQIVSGRAQRGAMLGLMNLTNTAPIIIAPALALFFSQTMSGGASLQALLGIAALAAASAGLFIMRIQSVR